MAAHGLAAFSGRGNRLYDIAEAQWQLDKGWRFRLKSDKLWEADADGVAESVQPRSVLQKAHEELRTRLRTIRFEEAQEPPRMMPSNRELWLPTLDCDTQVDFLHVFSYWPSSARRAAAAAAGDGPRWVVALAMPRPRFKTNVEVGHEIILWDCKSKRYWSPLRRMLLVNSMRHCGHVLLVEAVLLEGDFRPPVVFAIDVKNPSPDSADIITEMGASISNKQYPITVLPGTLQASPDYAAFAGWCNTGEEGGSEAMVVVQVYTASNLSLKARRNNPAAPSPDYKPRVCKLLDVNVDEVSSARWFGSALDPTGTMMFVAIGLAHVTSPDVISVHLAAVRLQDKDGYSAGAVPDKPEWTVQPFSDPLPDVPSSAKTILPVTDSVTGIEVGYPMQIGVGCCGTHVVVALGQHVSFISLDDNFAAGPPTSKVVKGYATPGHGLCTALALPSDEELEQRCVLMTSTDGKTAYPTVVVQRTDASDAAAAGAAKTAGDGAMTSCKLVVVGDDSVGKTTTLITYTTGTFPTEYVPTVFDNYTSNLMVDGKPVSVGLWDTAGATDYDRLRPLSYPGTDVFVVVVDVNNKAALDAVTARWKPELSYHSNAPIILAVNKSDLRDEDSIPRDAFKACARSIGAADCVEYSAKSQHGLKEVFDAAVRVALNPGAVDRRPMWNSLPLQPEGGSPIVAIAALDDEHIVAGQRSGRVSILSVTTGREPNVVRRVPLNELLPELSDFIFLSLQFISFRE